MKFGILMHKTTQNVGDDIQAYAASLLLPEVTYFLDREDLDSFKTDDGEPAAVVMSAWYMWRKWNWPPSKYIVPLFVGMHYTDNEKEKLDGSPVTTEFLTGIGKDYMNACGGIGCRDEFTRNTFDELGINAYFSGCITLTLPEQKRIKPQKEYVCTVDIAPEAEAHVAKLLAGSGIEHKIVKHRKDYRNSDATWEERVEYVKEILTVYQNAKCVVTRRLHCALPCLAMGVPVLLLNDENNGIRFEPYYSWLHYCRREAFVSGEYDYDIINPPANKQDYMPYRERLIKDVTEFAEKYKDVHGTPEELCPLNYDENELIRWRHGAMREAMDSWFGVTRKRIHEVGTLRKKLDETKKDLGDANKKLTDNEEKLAKAEKRIAKLEKENERLNKILSMKTVSLAIRARNAVLPKNKKVKLP